MLKTWNGMMIRSAINFLANDIDECNESLKIKDLLDFCVKL